ncbi:MAG: SpoIIE family protein phosphatase, partial [Eubacteriales bacterium]|nr:SpoIIE family protein phosphatase [Eubacteriales bacterium]
AIYWGVGTYTRMACTIATIVAGIFSALIRRYILDNKRASYIYGLAAGIITEVLHMLLVFVTNMEDMKRAFEVVQKCALPMIAATGISVMLAVLAVTRMRGEKGNPPREHKKIAQTFQRLLLICVVAAFAATSIFTSVMQLQLAQSNAGEILRLNLEDVRESIRSASDEELLDIAHGISARLPVVPTVEFLSLLADYYDVTDINVVDKNGIVTASNNPDFIGFDMTSTLQSVFFLPLLGGEEELVQDYQALGFDASIGRKYAGVSLASGGFVQVGYDAERFQQRISEQVVAAARHRRVGQTGFIVICDARGRITSDRDGHEGQHITLLGEADDSYDELTMYSAEIYGEASMFMYTKAEGYNIIAVLPKAEVMFSRDVAVYILAFMEIIVFAMLFGHVYFLISSLVVRNIQKINRSLASITAGDLSVTVDVRASEEFASLSDDINHTVRTLRRYIDEAAARIDQELEFARQIQLSALPSVFPPYPDRKDFSIFAAMDTAKEVGGDFYDFYMLGDRQLAFLIADVSGKGIPAAMFMMTAKTLIKSLVESGKDVDEAFTQANETLCQSNEAGMFVTAWLGILDTETGCLRFANAGHNPPAIRRRDGQYEFLKSRVNLVLAGMEGIRYRKNEVTLEPGDTLYLYTDGVTEAQNEAQALYGEERLLASLNAAGGADVEAVCRAVKRDVDAFAGTAQQFDDITMLCVRLSEQDDAETLETTPDAASSAQAAAFIEAQARKLNRPEKTAARLMIAADEV